MQRERTVLSFHPHAPTTNFTYSPDLGLAEALARAQPAHEAKTPFAICVKNIVYGSTTASQESVSIKYLVVSGSLP